MSKLKDMALKLKTLENLVDLSKRNPMSQTNNTLIDSTNNSDLKLTDPPTKLNSQEGLASLNNTDR